MNLTQRALAERSGRWAENWSAFVLRPRHMSRIVRAATGWASRRAWTQDFSWRYDLMVVSKWRWPKHVRDAWRPDVDPMLSGRGQSGNVISFRARRK